LKNSCKDDINIQIVFAKNLALIAQIGHRFLEISVGSCLKRRAEARKFKQEEEKKNIGIPSQVSEQFPERKLTGSVDQSSF
jgi:hypothetical protein